MPSKTLLMAGVLGLAIGAACPPPSLQAAEVPAASSDGAASPEKASNGAGAPYARSQAIKGVGFNWSGFRLLARGSDNWPMSWAANNHMYTSFGDGSGFGAKESAADRVSIGMAELFGHSAASLSGHNLIGGRSPAIAHCMPPAAGVMVESRSYNRNSSCFKRGLNGKSRGVLALGDQLFAWITPGSNADGYREGRLTVARIGTNKWRRASWSLTDHGARPLIFPTFLQAGKNHADLNYIYTYATGYAPLSKNKVDIQRGRNGGEVYLLRASRGADLLKQSNWQYFAGVDRSGRATWSGKGGAARPVFHDRNGTGPRVSAIYVKRLKRYILMSGHSKDAASRMGMFESTNPWGPWKTVFYGTLAGGSSGSQGFFYNIMPNSVSGDGRSFTLVYAQVGSRDGLSVVDGHFNPLAGLKQANGR